MHRHNGGRSQPHNNHGNKRKFHNQNNNNNSNNYNGVGENNNGDLVDDLMIASMAVAATWRDPSSASAPRPELDDSEDDSSSSDDSSSDDEDDSDSDADSDNDEDDDEDAEGEEETKADVTNDAEKKGETGNENPMPEHLQKEGATHNEPVIENMEATNHLIPETEDDAIDDEDDDVSDIDLTENLAQMEDDDDAPSKSTRGNRQQSSGNTNTNSAYEAAPRTEHEIDPYRCPTDQLDKLNVSVGIGDEEIIASSSKEHKGECGGIFVDEEMKKRLKIAGSIRSYIVEQRTIVVDSFVPSSSLQGGNFHQDSNSQTLDEGSMLVILTKKVDAVGNDDANISSSLVATLLNGQEEEGSGCYLQILGKIMEVFGPVQRPLYVIRLPDPPKARKKENTSKVVAAKKDDSKTVKVENAQIMEEEVERNLSAPAISDEKLENDNSNTDKKSDMEIVECIEETAVKAEEVKEDNTESKPDPDAIQIDEENSEDATEKSKTSESSDEKVVPQEDPWVFKGKLSVLLRSHPNMIVYSLMDNAKMVDTEQIIRVSGKGCDASNMYDEELGPSEQQYFSDDEEERQAKRGNRKPRKASDNDAQEGHTGGRGGGPNRGRDGGRDSGRGRGRGRGGSHGYGQFLSRNEMQQSHQHMHNPAPNPYANHNPHQFNPMQQAPPLPPSYAYQPPYQQGIYHQQQYQHQYQQNPQAHYGQPPQYPHPGYNMPHQPQYGAPPPPPPPPPPPRPPQNMNMPAQPSVAAHAPGQYSQVHQQPNGNASSPSQPPSSENDTVYYNY